MNPLVAKRKNRSGINTEKEYFIFGVYPYDPSFIFNHYNEKAFDYSENSLSIKNLDRNPIIISHFNNSDLQLEFLLLFKAEDKQLQLIRKLNSQNSDDIHKDNYMKQLVQIKPIPKGKLPAPSPLDIVDTKISSFSPKDDRLVLTDYQYQVSSDFLRFAREKRFGKMQIQIKEFSFQDLCFIPASISHLYMKNQFNGPFLIVVKSENTVNFLFELFNQWTLLKTLAMVGTEQELAILQTYAFPLIPEDTSTVKYHIVITTQSIFTQSRRFFTSLIWNLIIIVDNQKSYIQAMQDCSHFGININGIIEL